MDQAVPQGNSLGRGQLDQNAPIVFPQADGLFELVGRKMQDARPNDLVRFVIPDGVGHAGFLFQGLRQRHGNIVVHSEAVGIGRRIPEGHGGLTVVGKGILRQVLGGGKLYYIVYALCFVISVIATVETWRRRKRR